MTGAPIIVLAHAGDRGAERAAGAAQSRGLAVCVVRPAELATAARWTHAIDARGTVSGELRLRSGTVLDTGRVGCVLNRLGAIEPPAFARAPARERDYAAAELQAFVVSWLAGLRRPVINPAGAAFPSRRQWLARAAAAGIAVVPELVATGARLVPAGAGATAVVRGPWPETAVVARQPFEVRSEPAPPLTRVLVTGDRVHGDAPASVAERAVDLARRSGHMLLELWFDGTEQLADVEPMPSLMADGDAEAVADLLERSCAAGP